MKSGTLQITLFLTLFGTLCQAQLPTECFGQSRQVYGKTDLGDEFTHKDELMSPDFTEHMRISQIKGCVNQYNRLTGLQIRLKEVKNGNEAGTLDLASFGDVSGFCTNFILGSDGSYVKSLLIGYNARDGIDYVAFTGKDGEFRVFGQKEIQQGATIQPIEQKWQFTKTNQLIGLYGTNRIGIESLGVLIYKTNCMEESDNEAQLNTQESNFDDFTAVVDDEAEVREEEGGSITHVVIVICVTVLITVNVLVVTLICCVRRKYKQRLQVHLDESNKQSDMEDDAANYESQQALHVRQETQAGAMLITEKPCELEVDGQSVSSQEQIEKVEKKEDEQEVIEGKRQEVKLDPADYQLNQESASRSGFHTSTATRTLTLTPFGDLQSNRTVDVEEKSEAALPQISQYRKLTGQSMKADQDGDQKFHEIIGSEDEMERENSLEKRKEVQSHIKHDSGIDDIHKQNIPIPKLGAATTVADDLTDRKSKDGLESGFVVPVSKSDEVTSRPMSPKKMTERDTGVDNSQLTPGKHQ